MASRKSTGTKSKFKGDKPARASAIPPQMPTARRPQTGATTMVPQPSQVGGHAPAPDVADDGPVPLKKQELIAMVVERSDVAKKHAKPVVEAMLAVLGEALGEGRDLNLQPMGKIKRKRMKDTGKARVMVASIRQPNAPEAGAVSGADSDSDSDTDSGGMGGDDAPLISTAIGRRDGARDQADNRVKEAVADGAE